MPLIPPHSMIDCKHFEFRKALSTLAFYLKGQPVPWRYLPQVPSVRNADSEEQDLRPDSAVTA